MNRRGFLKFLPAAVGGIALSQAIPFNRVWSFPSKIVVPRWQVGIDYAFTEDFAVMTAYDRLTGRTHFRPFTGEQLAAMKHDKVALAGLMLPDGTSIAPSQLYPHFL